MENVELTIGPELWSYDTGIRRWIHVTGPLAGLTQEIVDGQGVTIDIDGGGYHDGPNQADPLPAGSFKALPFPYFERSSDVIAGLFDVDVIAPRLRLLVKTPFDAKPARVERFRASMGKTGAVEAIAPMASMDSVVAMARPYFPMILTWVKKWLATRR